MDLDGTEPFFVLANDAMLQAAVRRGNAEPIYMDATHGMQRYGLDQSELVSAGDSEHLVCLSQVRHPFEGGRSLLCARTDTNGAFRSIMTVASPPRHDVNAGAGLYFSAADIIRCG